MGDGGGRRMNIQAWQPANEMVNLKSQRNEGIMAAAGREKAGERQVLYGVAQNGGKSAGGEKRAMSAISGVIKIRRGGRQQLKAQKMSGLAYGVKRLNGEKQHQHQRNGGENGWQQNNGNHVI